MDEIHQNTRLRSTALVPEVRLHLIHDDAPLWVDPERQEGRLPCWGIAWGAGQALARWLLDHREAAQDQRMIDLGCGSGLCGIAAKLAGARSVDLLDIDPVAIEAARRNAAANGTEVCVRLGDFRSVSLDEYDVILAADVRHFEPDVMDGLRKRALARQVVFAAEPDRRGTSLWPEEVLQVYNVRAEPSLEAFYVQEAVVARLSRVESRVAD